MSLSHVQAACYLHTGANKPQHLKDLEGPLSEVIEQLIAFVMDNTQCSVRFNKDSNQREEVHAYPEQEVREGISRAFTFYNPNSLVIAEVGLSYLKIWNSDNVSDSSLTLYAIKNH